MSIFVFDNVGSVFIHYFIFDMGNWLGYLLYTDKINKKT